MLKTVDRAVEIGANALQIFSDNPTAWKRRATLPAELPAFRDRLRELDIGPLAIHASYLINLAGPDDVFYEPSIELLAHELVAGRSYGARFVNVHIGSHKGGGIDAGLARLGTGIARVFRRADELRAAGTDPHTDGAETATGGPGDPIGGAADGPAEPGADPLLVLENSAGGGGGVGTTVGELARILEAATAQGAPAERIAFCFDTAHLWSAGHDLRDDEVRERLLGEFDARIGIDRLVMVHVNDSKADLGSRLDRHEHVGAGRIGARGMGELLRHPALGHVAFYIETPGMDEGYDAVNMERVRLLLAGRLRLPRLPAEALSVRGSRSRRSLPESGPA
jgi:deoxyribonuclease-4